jgi:hypothetical protein
LKDEIRGQVFVESEQENLLHAHDLIFLEALGEIQKDVVEAQDDQCNVVEFCRTSYRCGMTVLAAPRGIIHRVYLIQKREGKYDWCRPVFLQQREYYELESWSRTFRHRASSAGLGRLPLGLTAADASNDSKHGRAHNGLYAIHDHNIYIAPWLQSDEAVVIEWKGIKPTTRWTDDDLVDDSPEFKKAVKLFFQYAHERDYGTDPAQRSSLHEDYNDALSELMLQRREETRVKAQEPFRPHHHRSHLERLLEVRPIHVLDEPAEKDWVFAHLGNNGTENSASDAVAAAVIAIDPDAILATGGNLLGASYDLSVGRNFYSYIFPYVGTYGQGAYRNKFWPTIDDLDWADSLSAFKAFFSDLPNNGRYYDVCYGPVHFFFLDSSASDSDGNGSTSEQADWLRIKLAISTAKWKVVVLSDPPYSSDAEQTLAARWPFQTWGADLVLSGEALNYERFSVGGFPYIVNGLGGAGLVSPVIPTANSEAIYFAGFGYGKLTVNEASLKYEFIAVDGTVIDTLQL